MSRAASTSSAMAAEPIRSDPGAFSTVSAVASKGRFCDWTVICSAGDTASTVGRSRRSPGNAHLWASEFDAHGDARRD